MIVHHLQYITCFIKLCMRDHRAALFSNIYTDIYISRSCSEYGVLLGPSLYDLTLESRDNDDDENIEGGKNDVLLSEVSTSVVRWGFFLKDHRHIILYILVATIMRQYDTEKNHEHDTSITKTIRVLY